MDNLYKRLSRKCIAESVIALGHEITFMIQGPMGSGKSALKDDLQAAFPDYRAVYIDMTQITDSGDFQIPAVDHTTRTSSFYPNEMLGVHMDQPSIIMFDELGKRQDLINTILPVLNDRRWGNRYFHPKTIVLASSNTGAENLGDMFKDHQRDRMTFATMAKMQVPEWLPWAFANDIDPVVAAWVTRNPQCFAEHDDVPNPDLNHYIWHPKAKRQGFTTHRSVTRASTIIKKRDVLPLDTIAHLLIGTIGQAAAMDLLVFEQLAPQLPTKQDILANPKRAPVPTAPAAVVMLVCQALKWVDESNLTAWMTYMQRFKHKEAQALFALQAKAQEDKLVWMSKNDSFTKFTIANDYLFS
jgi:hypothetical protein